MRLLSPIRSFGAKLTLLVTFTTGVAVLLVSAIVAMIDYRDNEAQTAALAAAETNIIAVNSEAPLAFGDPQLGSEALAALRAASSVALARLYTRDGTIFAEYDNTTITAPRYPLLAPGLHSRGRWLVATNRIEGPAGELGWLQITFDRSAARARALSNVALVFVIAGLTMLFAFLVATRIRRFLVKPIDELAASARHVSETQDYSVRATKHGEDELGKFTDVFNEMLAQIQKQDAEIQHAHQQRERLLKSEKSAREEVEHASRVKDQFLATLSHELRTPLNAIMGWAQILRRGGQPADQVAKGVEIIERNARMQAQIIEDLLDMSRIVAGTVRLDVQPVNLAEVVESALATVRPAADAKGIRIQTVLDPRVSPVRGDPSRLQQVMWNLGSNAIKFTPRGGRVQVIVQRVNSHAEIVVTDTGQGIASEFLPYVFERFRQSDSSSTRRHGGLGLGLAIVKQLVELHGGTVRASSRGEGQGATFTVELPLMAVHADETAPDRVHPRISQAAATLTSPLSFADLKVLVVDDEPDTLDLVCHLLQEHGAKTAGATSAAEALQVFRSFQPDVLISDIGMPDQDGYDLIQRIRALEAPAGTSTPAIALTAFARSEDRTRALMAGYQMHLAKPVEAAELVATVASVAGLTVRGGSELR